MPPTHINQQAPVTAATDNLAIVTENRIAAEQITRALDAYGMRPNTNQEMLLVARTHFRAGFLALEQAVAAPENPDPEWPLSAA